MYRLSGNCFLRNRPMRKSTYGGFVSRLLGTYKWLEHESFNPAPGHLRQVEDLLIALQSDVIPWSGDGLKLVVSFACESAEISYSLKESCKLSDQKELLVKNLIQRAKSSCQRVCAACGGATIRMSKCDLHDLPYRLFSDDFRGKRKVKSKFQQVAADSMWSESSLLSAPKVSVFPMADDEAFHDEAKSSKTGRENPERQKVLMAVKENGGEIRQLRTYPNAWDVVLEQFEARFPNFHELACLLRKRTALSKNNARVITLPPILLEGPPGIGKTVVMNWLSTALKLPYERIDMASVQTNGALVGSDRMWANTQLGLVFKTLMNTPFANPIIMLDEIEKTSSDLRFDPQTALLGLFEKSSAKHFKDLSANFEIDASHINWIITSNNSEFLSKPLLSRLMVLKIPAPTPLQVSQIAQTIYSEKLKEHNCHELFPAKFRVNIANYLGGLSPRALGRVIEDGIGNALLEGRQELILTDFDCTKFVATPFGFNLNSVH